MKQTFVTAVMGMTLVLLSSLAAPAVKSAAASTARPAESGSLMSCGDGITLTRLSPPKRFDPRTASNATLRAADFPARPSDPALLATWQRYAARYAAGRVVQGSTCRVGPKHTHPPATSSQSASGEVTSATSGGSSPYWAGNVAHNEPYTDAEAQWVVPYASGGSGTDSSHWVGVGLGDSSTYPVVQAGSDSPGWNVGSYGWVEVYPQQHQVVLSQLYSIQGDLMMAHVRFTSNLATFHVVDETLGVEYQFSEGFSGIKPDGHAEFIVERPANSSGVHYCLANFGSVRFTSAQAAAPNFGWHSIGALPHYYLWMQNGTHRLAYPGPIDSTGYAFSAIWENYC